MSFVYAVNPNGGLIYKRAVEVPFSKTHLLEGILSAEEIRPRAGVMVKGRILATPAEVSQGGPFSPLIAIILLDDLDKELERRGHHFVPYADDFLGPVILMKHPVRTRMQGVVGAGGLKPPATRLYFIFVCYLFRCF